MKYCEITTIHLALNKKLDDHLLHVAPATWVKWGQSQTVVNKTHENLVWRLVIAPGYTEERPCPFLYRSHWLVYHPSQNCTQILHLGEVAWKRDLDSLENWAHIWGMKFNPSKCTILTISRSPPLHKFYSLCGTILQQVSEAKYLGVNISEDLHWSKHIQGLASKQVEAGPIFSGHWIPYLFFRTSPDIIGYSRCPDFSGHVRRPSQLPKLTRLLTSAISVAI